MRKRVHSRSVVCNICALFFTGCQKTQGNLTVTTRHLSLDEARIIGAVPAQLENGDDGVQRYVGGGWAEWLVQSC